MNRMRTSLVPVEPGRSSFKLWSFEPSIRSANGRARLGPSSSSRLIAAATSAAVSSSWSHSSRYQASTFFEQDDDPSHPHSITLAFYNVYLLNEPTRRLAVLDGAHRGHAAESAPLGISSRRSSNWEASPLDTGRQAISGFKPCGIWMGNEFLSSTTPSRQGRRRRVRRLPCPTEAQPSLGSSRSVA